MQPTGQLPQAYVRSFIAVCDIVSLVRELQHSLERITPDSLLPFNRLQQDHQKLFEIYGVEHKPKHHHRMHLGHHWLSCGVLLACDPLESKHQFYKSGVADHQQSTVKDYAAFSAATLPRVIQACMTNLGQAGLPFWELLPPIQEADLEDKIFFASQRLCASTSFSTLSLYFLYMSVNAIAEYVFLEQYIYIYMFTAMCPLI